MKVIFLDIDGVMNSQVFYESRYKKRWFTLNEWWYLLKRILIFLKFRKPTTSLNYKTPKDYYTFDSQFKSLARSTCPQKWKWLSKWCNENNVKICISSVWKHNFGTSDNKSTPELWEKALINLGFKSDTFVGITGSRRTLRGTEIKEWLDKHSEVTDYAILDDDSDMLPEQFCKFHHCDPWFGLTPNHLYRIKFGWDNNISYEHLSEIIKR